MTIVPKYMLKSNLSEKQIEADVSSFLGWCTPHDEDSPFRLLDVDEQRTGADKLFDRGMAIYIQFKKSSGLKPTSAIHVSNRKNKSPLEDVRHFRAVNGLEDDPTLYFQLRAKAKNAHDLQHNVLLGYEIPPWSRAIYIAPLLLDKVNYHSALFQSSSRFLLDPFYYHIHYSIHHMHGISHLGAVPFLREHISIPPHEKVNDHHHYYAYSEAGVDVSWHSPSIVSREPHRLSDFMVALFHSALTDPESMLTKQALVESISQIGEEFGYERGEPMADESPIGSIGRHGKWLSSTYDIRQLILLGNSQRIAELRV